jgi:hypothetical protein
MKLKLPSSVSKFLEKKYVFYVVSFIAFVTILGYLTVGNIKAVLFFLLVGYLVHCLNKNKTVALLIAIALTGILASGSIIKEGVENMSADPLATAAKAKAVAQDSSANPIANAAAKVAETPVAQNVKAKAVTAKTTVQTEKTTEESPTTAEPMTNKKGKNGRIDYASTVEDAYDDLNKILGGDGIKRLTDDTQKLMGQQMKLAEAMKSMTPLMNQAKDLIKGFDLKGLGDIGNMAKQFGAGKK